MNMFYLHGMGGSPRDWREVQKLVPGEAVALPDGLSFEDTAEEIASRLRRTKSPFVLCGYSMGGRLAIRVATKLGGSPLMGLVLLSTGFGFADESERLARLDTDRQWARLTAENPAQFWRDWYAQDLFASFRQLPESKRADWLTDRFSLNIEHLRSQFLLLGPAQHGHLGSEIQALAASGISVLYIAGERDKKYSGLAQKIENIPVEILSGGHILPLECPGEVARSLEHFLARLKKRN